MILADMTSSPICSTDLCLLSVTLLQDTFDTRAWLRGEYQSTFSTGVDSVSGSMAVAVGAATFAASRLLKNLSCSQQKQSC